MAFATVEELTSYLGGAALDPTAAQQALDLATAEVIAATGNRFEEATLAAVLGGTGSPVMILPDLPVSAVVEVLAAQGRADEDEVEADRFDWDEDGVLELIDGTVWARRRRWYRVTYTAGLSEVPAVVVGVVLGAAGRLTTNPQGLTGETLGRYSYTLAGNAAGGGLTADERARLEPWFISTRLRGTPEAPPEGS